MADANHRISIAALTGGISKQPDHIALPGQTRTATNATCSVADGMSNRNGSRYVARLTNFAGTLTNVRMHAIDRDGSTKYVIVYGNDVGTGLIKMVAVDAIAGTAATITTTAIQTYLDSGTTTADDLRLVTNADYTIVVNTKATPLVGTSENYVVAKEYRDYDIMLSVQPAANSYASTRDDTATQPKGYYKYDGTSARFAQHVFTTVASTTWATHDATNAGYLKPSNNPSGFTVAMRRVNVSFTNATWTAAGGLADSGGVLTAGAGTPFSGYTYRAGDYLYISTGTGFTVGWHQVTATNGSTTITLAATPGMSTPDNTPVITNVGSTGATNGIGASYVVSADFRDENPTDMHDVAAVYQKALRRAGADNALVSWTRTNDGSTSAGYMTLVSHFDGGDAVVYTPTSPSSGIVDLTQSGEPFFPSLSTAGSGTAAYTPPINRWTKVAAPFQAKAVITPGTWPAQITLSGGTFTAAEINWIDRLSGDNETNPIPTPITSGYKITDAAFLDGRLWLSAGETVFSSQQGDVFNFFAFDSTNLVDSDPIEAPIGDSQVNLIEFLTPVRKGLVISTLSGRQFELTAENGFTPTSTAVTPTTSRKTHTSVRPARSDSLIYMVGPLANGSAVYEYVYDDVQITSIAGDITAHVPDLIGTSVKSIHAAPEQQVVIVLDGSGNLWHYGYFFRGQEKVQSAWTKWTRATNQIRAATIVGSDLFILRDGNSAMVLEKIPLGREAIPSAYTGFTTGVHLDCQMVVAGSNTSPTTTFNLPDSLSDTTITAAALVNGTALTLGGTGTARTVTGDYYTGSPVVVLGQPFSVSAQLARPYVRDQNGVADINKQVTMREVITKHQNTGAYTLRCAVSGSADRTKVFTPASGITEAAGTMRSWFNGDTKRQTITVESSSHLPLTITGIEYFVESSSRDI